MILYKPFFKNPDDYTDINDLKDYVRHLIEIYNKLIDEYNKIDSRNEDNLQKLWIVKRDMNKILKKV